jgi:aspartate carbamoyltransferase catalytic subunit
MFGKSRLKKIISMLNDLTDEELDELIAAADEMKDGDSEEEIEEKTEEVVAARNV